MQALKGLLLPCRGVTERDEKHEASHPEVEISPQFHQENQQKVVISLQRSKKKCQIPKFQRFWL